MSKSLRKVLLTVCIAILCVVTVFAVASSVNNFKSARAQSVATFDMAGASVRVVDPTGIRFVTEVDKDYRDVTLSGKTYTFGTLMIPQDLYDQSGASELTHAVEGAYEVISTVWGENLENGNYSFNAVLYNLPESEYNTPIMARSFIKIIEFTLNNLE